MTQGESQYSHSTLEFFHILYKPEVLFCLLIIYEKLDIEHISSVSAFLHIIIFTVFL